MITSLAAGPNPAPDPTWPHILLVLDQFPKTLGGGERIVLRLAALLPRYGYRVSILTFLSHPETSALDHAPCSIYLLPLVNTYNLTALKAALELKRFIRQQQVRIVQTFFESSDLWAGMVTRALTPARLIWSRRDMGILRGRKHHIAYRLLARMPHRVFAVSELVRRHAVEIDGIDPERVQTIYNGLDLPPDASSALSPDGSITITTVGNLRHVKGHDVLLEAAALVLRRFPQVSFTIAGESLDEVYFEQLQRMVQDLGLSHAVHFLGNVTALREHLATASLFTLPSRSEGFSNAIIEAMAAGLPVVATDVGGNAEAVKEGVTGLIVPAEDAEALAGALCKLLADPASAHRMGQAGRQRVSELFTAEAMMEQVCSTYARLLHS